MSERHALLRVTAGLVVVLSLLLVGESTPSAVAAETVRVMFTASTPYGVPYGMDSSAHSLSMGIPVPDPAVTYVSSDASDQSANISGSLVCQTAAEPTGVTTGSPGAYTDLSNCHGLTESDSNYQIVYDTADSSYTVTPAPLTITVAPGRPSTTNPIENIRSGWVPCPANTGFATTQSESGGSFSNGAETLSYAAAPVGPPANTGGDQFAQASVQVAGVVLDTFDGSFPVRAASTTSVSYGEGANPGAISSASWSHGHATVTFGRTRHAPPVGASLTVAGAEPAGFDGTFTITSAKRGSASWASTNPGKVTFQSSSMSWSGATAKLGFSPALSTTPPVGARVTVSGAVPAGYNGTHTVTASTPTSVSYALATDPQSASLTVTDIVDNGNNTATMTFGAVPTAPPIGSIVTIGESTNAFNGSFTIASSTTTTATIDRTSDSAPEANGGVATLNPYGATGSLPPYGGSIAPTGGNVTFTPQTTSCAAYGSNRLAVAVNEAIVADQGTPDGGLAGFGVPAVVPMGNLAAAGTCKAGTATVSHDANWSITASPGGSGLHNIVCSGAADPNYTITYAQEHQNVWVTLAPTAVFDLRDPTTVPTSRPFVAHVQLETGYGSFGVPQVISPTAASVMTTGAPVSGRKLTVSLYQSGVVAHCTTTATDSNGAGSCQFSKSTISAFHKGVAAVGITVTTPGAPYLAPACEYCRRITFGSPPPSSPSYPPTLATGQQHSCATDATGRIECWGDDSLGQLDGVVRTAPGQGSPPGHSQFEMIAAGDNHTCGIRTNHTLLCWGDNSAGQLDGIASASVHVANPAGKWRDISAGGDHTCGVVYHPGHGDDKTIACWGYLGKGVTVCSTNKCESPSNSMCLANSALSCHGPFEEVAVGEDHACGLRTSGLVSCWGDNTYGQAPNCSLVLACAAGFSALTAGAHHSCGIRKGGSQKNQISCWGDDSSGQLDQIPSITNHESDCTAAATPCHGTFTQITAGGAHTCGIRTNGLTTCWGNNADGEGPDCTKSTAACFGPFWTQGLKGAYTGAVFAPDTDINAGGFHTCGVTLMWWVTCWGRDLRGQVGSAPDFTRQPSAVIDPAALVASKGKIVYSVSAEASPAATYQWYLISTDGFLHEAGHGQTHSVKCALGAYWSCPTNLFVVATNVEGSVESNLATVTAG